MKTQTITRHEEEDAFLKSFYWVLGLIGKMLRYLGRRAMQNPLVGLLYLLVALPAAFLIVQDLRLLWATAMAPRFTQPTTIWLLSEPVQPWGVALLVLVIISVVTVDRWLAYRATRRAAKRENTQAPLRIDEWVLGRSYNRTWNPDPGEFKLESTGELYRLTEEHLRTHMIVVAPTGSGKTVSVLEPALQLFKRIGAAAIYLDAKGDSFDPKQFHLNFDLNDPANSMRLLVWSGRTPREMAERLAVALVSDTGTEHPYYVRNAKFAMSALVGAHHRAYRQMPSLSLLLTYLRSADAREDLAEQLRQMGVPEKGSELEDVGRVGGLAEQKHDVLGSLDTALAPLCRGAVAELLVADAKCGYSIEELVAQPVRVRFAISTNDHPDIAPIVGRLVMAQFTYAVVSPGCNKKILKAIVADEAKRFVTPTVADGMAMARENRGAYLLAFQNLSQITDPTLRQDILSVAGNKLVMAGVDDEDAEKFSRLFGSREQQYISHTQNTSQGNNSSRSRGSGREDGNLLGGLGGAGGSLRHQTGHVQSSSVNQSQGSNRQVRERANFLPSEIRELPQFHVLIERRDSRGQIMPATVVHMDYELISGVRDWQALKLYEQVGRLEAVSPELPRISRLPAMHDPQVGDPGSEQSQEHAQPVSVCMYRHPTAGDGTLPSPAPASSPASVPTIGSSNEQDAETTGADSVPTLGTIYPEWVAAGAHNISSLLGIDAAQAHELARIAFNNGRSATYLSDNLEYVRFAPKVKSPAGLFAYLVHSNKHKAKAATTIETNNKGREPAKSQVEGKEEKASGCISDTEEGNTYCDGNQDSYGTYGTP